MRRIAIANRKGGVGKTTTAVHLAVGLGEVGQRVLLVDCDPQGSCSKMLGAAPEYRLEHLLEGSAGEPIQVRKNVDLLAASPRLAIVAQSVLMREFNPQLILSEKLARFADYHYVICDTNPSYSSLSVNVLFYCSEVFVPVSMETLAAEGMMVLRSEIEGMREAGSASITAVIPTMVDGRKGLSADMVESMTGAFPDMVAPSIRYQALFSELPDEGVTIFEKSPTSRGAEDYVMLTGWVANGS